MANLTPCPRCGAEFDPRRGVTCPNGHLVSGRRPSRPEPEPAPAPEQQPDPAAPASQAAAATRICPGADCGAEVSAQAAVCPYCERALGFFRLRFPWGEAAVPDTGALALGRLADFSPLASALEPFDGVSRRHALVQLDGDDLVITDLASTNGTFVDGRRIQPHAPERVRPGARITLGRLLAVEVVG